MSPSDSDSDVGINMLPSVELSSRSALQDHQDQSLPMPPPALPEPPGPPEFRTPPPAFPEPLPAFPEVSDTCQEENLSSSTAKWRRLQPSNADAGPNLSVSTSAQMEDLFTSRSATQQGPLPPFEIGDLFIECITADGKVLMCVCVSCNSCLE